MVKERDEFYIVPLFTSYVTLPFRVSVFAPVETGLVRDLRHQLSCLIASFRKLSLALCTLARLGPLVCSFIASAPNQQAILPLGLNSWNLISYWTHLYNPMQYKLLDGWFTGHPPLLPQLEPNYLHF